MRAVPVGRAGLGFQEPRVTPADGIAPICRHRAVLAEALVPHKAVLPYWPIRVAGASGLG